jgi:putative radical SAM enzyme (TIGR03279 family)
MDVIRRFADAGITMNCQIVCCPGLNDGAQLLQSLNDLKALYPAVASVSVVPVGITKHREGLYPLTPVDGKKAAEILDMTDSFGEKCLAALGCRLFYCADELYLKAGREIPPEDYYENYPQIENGVGMLRSLEEEFKAALKLMDEASSEPFSIATGLAAECFLKKLLTQAQEKCNNINCEVYGIKNQFFGETVDVAGLVSGGDLVSQLKDKKLGSRLLIPASMLRHGGDIFLDDLPLKDAEAALGLPIITVPNDGFELAEAIFNNQER